MISVGDSIVWGQALPENQKMYTLTQQWLSNKLNRPVHNRVYAHSGATVRQPNPTGDVVKWPGEVPAGYPWISTQIECAAAESQLSAPIDFVLLDGCINDITATTIVGEEHSREFLSAKIREYCHDAFLNLLKDTLDRFPSAYVVVLGYFQIVSSRQSDVLQAVISYLGGHPIDPRSPAQFAEQTAMWERHSTEELKRAVNDVNYNVSRNGRHYRRAIFVSPNFTDENAYGGGDPLLATRTDPDPFEGQRDGWCSFHNHRPLINALTAYSCRHPNLFHPNRRGAERYADAIKKGLTELLNQSPVVKTVPPILQVCTDQKIQFTASDVLSNESLTGMVLLNEVPFSDLNQEKVHTFHLNRTIRINQPPSLESPLVEIRALRANAVEELAQYQPTKIAVPLNLLPLFVAYETDKPLFREPKTDEIQEQVEDEAITVVIRAAEDAAFSRSVPAEVYIGARLKGGTNISLLTTRREIFSKPMPRIQPRPKPLRRKCPTGMPRYKQIDEGGPIDCYFPEETVETDPVIREEFIRTAFARWSVVPFDCFPAKELAGIPSPAR